MRGTLLFAFLTSLLTASAETLLQQSAFRDPASEGWKPWSPRPEIAPRTFVDTVKNRGEAGSLAINGASNPAAYGGWHRVISGVRPGDWLRFRAYYRVENVAAENWQTVARLDWRDESGKRVAFPEYMSWARRDGSWTEISGHFQAPPKTAGVEVQLQLLSAPQGTVWWDDITLETTPPPSARKITVASVNLRPRNTSGREESVARFVATIEKHVPGNADLIVLPEGISVVGTTKTYPEIAESIPGPTTKTLGAVARQRNAYIVAGIYEREGPAVYNTAVLIDRRGEVAGKYRKVYLPREEVERGLTPGMNYPVFQTDFGTVGLMICYDVFFTDPARALATQGADLIAMPIWGGDENLAKARAIENGVYLIASGYDHPTYVMDPLGERLSQARDEAGSVAVATIDLTKKFHLPWLGEMRTRRLKELRVDVPQPVPGLAQ